LGWGKFNISDFSDLETVGCDGHHIKTDPAGNRHKQTASCGGAMKALIVRPSYAELP
jgi:hypothetical protein